MLSLLRVGQGVALGGVWDGLPSLLSLNAPPNRRGWYSMIPQLGAPLGLIVASGLFAFFLSTLSASDFLDWAGDIPSSWHLPSTPWRCSRGYDWSRRPTSRVCSKHASYGPLP